MDSSRPNSESNLPRQVGSNAPRSNAFTQRRTPTAAVEATLEPLVGPRIAKTARLLARLVIVAAALYSALAFTPVLSTLSTHPSPGIN
jgi:hypothetical protein